MGKLQIWVMVRDGENKWSGRLVPGRADTVQVTFDSGKGPLTMPLGSTVELGFATLGMANAVRDGAKLVRVDRQRDDGLKCTFDVENPEQLIHAVPGAVTDPRLDRQWVRVEAGKEPVAVPVTLPDEPAATQRVLGRLRDGSAGGLGLIFPLAAEPRLARALTFKAAVSWPGFEGTREWTCEVRSRALLPDNEVRYGVQFRTEAYDAEPPGPRFEKLWDCPGCRTVGLLAETHAFCPTCGEPRTEAVRDPLWGDRASRDTHPLAAADSTCPACGGALASIAHHCPGCGAAQPDDQEEQPTQRGITSPRT